MADEPPDIPDPTREDLLRLAHADERAHLESDVPAKDKVQLWESLKQKYYDGQRTERATTNSNIQPPQKDDTVTKSKPSSAIHNIKAAKSRVEKMEHIGKRVTELQELGEALRSQGPTKAGEQVSAGELSERNIPPPDRWLPKTIASISDALFRMAHVAPLVTTKPPSGRDQATPATKQAETLPKSEQPWQSLTPPEQNRRNWQAVVQFSKIAMDAVFHPDRLWRQLTTWPVVSAFVLLGIGSGIGVLSMTPPLFVFAKLCFIGSAIILWLKVAHWLTTSRAAQVERMILTFLIFGVSGMVLVEAIRWISRNQESSVAQASVAKTPPPSPSSALEVQGIPTVHDQFLMYQSLFKTPIHQFWITPTGEQPLQVEARLSFSRVHDRQEELVVYIPGARRARLASACGEVIFRSQEWMKEIAKREAENFDFKTFSFYLPRREVVIFHEGELNDETADNLERQGHKLIGPRTPSVVP